MKDQKFILEIGSRVRVVGTLDQCTKLLTLVSEMQTVEDDYGTDGYVYYPVQADVELKAIVGRHRLAESKEAAQTMNRKEPAKEPAPMVGSADDAF